MNDQRSIRRPINMLAWVLLAALILLLGFRLGALESVRQSIQEIANRIAARQAATIPANAVADPANAGAMSAADVAAAPVIGPSFIAVYAIASLLLAALATLAAVNAGAFSWRRAGQFVLIAGILAWALASTFHAQNRFLALLGTADLAATLAACWTLLVILHQRLLGDAGRRMVAAAAIACISINCFKAIDQYFFEFPDFAQYVHDHRAQALQSQGIVDDPALAQLFLSRVASNEVYGFALDSDVLASELIPGAALLALLIAASAGWFSARRSPAEFAAPAAGEPLDYASRKPRSKPPADPPSQVQIPPEVPAFIASAILLFLVLWVLVLTGSKGGIAAAVLVLGLAAIGFFGRHWIARHRRGILAIAAAAAALGIIAVISYGRRHDALPTRSLLFRWHYWTASLPIIKKSPLLGVGLNNFGDYYLQFKRPSSPEDVSDPHNLFIRFAAETGIPEAIAVGLLILWLLQGAFRAGPGKTSPLVSDPHAHLRYLPLSMVSLAVAIAWALLHGLLAEPVNEYTLIVTLISALLAWSLFLAAWLLLNLPARPPASLFRENSAASPALQSPPLISPRALCATLALAALGMLLYDQVNLALVTGPVATFFWMLLAAADSDRPTAGVSTIGAPSAPADPPRTRFALASAGIAVSLLFAGAFFVGLFSFALPLFSQTFPWDPAAPEIAYIRSVNGHDWLAASRDLDAAIALAPRNIELRLQRITLDRDQLHRPVAAEIRWVFALDRSNAMPRVKLALPDSDLPPAERIAALTDALSLDARLDPGEPKRLSPETLAAVKAKIAELEAAPANP